MTIRTPVNAGRNGERAFIEASPRTASGVSMPGKSSTSAEWMPELPGMASSSRQPAFSKKSNTNALGARSRPDFRPRSVDCPKNRHNLAHGRLGFDSLDDCWYHVLAARSRFRDRR